MNSASDEAFPSCLDLDSWCGKYLIDEILENLDADWCSNYFFCQYEDGSPRFFGGPLWDYDGTLGDSHRNRIPRAFLANAEYKVFPSYSPYYHALYQNPVFYERTVTLYREMFHPLLEELVNGGLGGREDQIAAASRMNAARWSFEEDKLSVKPLEDYLWERLAFLDEAWLDGVAFRTIQIEGTGGECLSFSVEKGEAFALPDREEFVGDGLVWYNQETGEDYQFGTPVTENLFLGLRKNVKMNALFLAEKLIKGKRGRPMVLCSLTLGGAIGVLAWPDVRLWLDERRRDRRRRRYEPPGEA